MARYSVTNYCNVVTNMKYVHYSVHISYLCIHCNPFLLNCAKFDICTVVGLNGTLRPKRVQMPNLALTRHETDNSVCRKVIIV
jgi:hypothetical protein